MGNFSSIENDKAVIVIIFGSLGKENFFIMKDTLRNFQCCSPKNCYCSQAKGNGNKKTQAEERLIMTVSLFSSIHRIYTIRTTLIFFGAHTCASTSDLSDRIKLCAAISCSSWRQITTSLRCGLLIIDDKSCRSFGTPLGTGSLSYMNGKKNVAFAM